MPGLRDLRTERRLSLEALSILADVDVATISRLERGLTEARPDTIVKLARGLGISARRMRSILSACDGDAA
jgi:transcriptional regulator with XRE-family HTH domain